MGTNNYYTLTSILLLFFISSCSKNTKSDSAVIHDSIMKKNDSLEIVEERKKEINKEKNALAKPYNEKANAEYDINALIKKATSEKKNIILQAGGNWCIWCLRFNDFINKNNSIKNIIDENYLYYHLNYSPKNKNENIFNKYGNPGETYGYPVFIVLNSQGELIHTQDSAILEDGRKGYDETKVTDFFSKWKPIK